MRKGGGMVERGWGWGGRRGWDWGRGLSMRMIVGVRMRMKMRSVKGIVGVRGSVGGYVKRNNSKPSRVYQSKGDVE